MSILIKNVTLNREITDIYIQDGKIREIGHNLNPVANRIIDGSLMAAVPSFFNGHTHASMTLMRGYGDDMDLIPWLEHKIWPLESKLDEEAVYWGAKLAALEMIKSGTTFMNDMYQRSACVAKAYQEMGIKARLAQTIFDHFDQSLAKTVQKEYKTLVDTFNFDPALIDLAVGPHAIYTVSTEMLKWSMDFAVDHDMQFHIHLSETQYEVDQCLKQNGVRPVEYMKSIGVLNERAVLAHCLHINDDEIQMIADAGAKIIHNPASNQKLASGNKFRYQEMIEAGISVGIGTDGTSSSNNLDMYEALKLASLWAKSAYADPKILPADEAFALATTNTEAITGVKTGKIEIGYAADIQLINLDLPELTPCHDLISNLVYSANGSCVDTLISNGKIVMEKRIVDDEKDILKNVRRITQELLSRL